MDDESVLKHLRKPVGPNKQGEEEKQEREKQQKGYDCILFHNKKLSSEEKSSKFPFIKEKTITLVVPLFNRGFITKLPPITDEEFYKKQVIEAASDKGFTKPDLFNNIKSIYLDLSKDKQFILGNSSKKVGDLKLKTLTLKQLNNDEVWVVKFDSK